MAYPHALQTPAQPAASQETLGHRPPHPHPRKQDLLPPTRTAHAALLLGSRAPGHLQALWKLSENKEEEKKRDSELQLKRLKVLSPNFAGESKSSLCLEPPRVCLFQAKPRRAPSAGGRARGQGGPGRGGQGRVPAHMTTGTLKKS